MKRRDFLKISTLASIPSGESHIFSQRKASKRFGELSFGVCADLHHDIYYDAPYRLKRFIDEMKELKPDFIIQLGDFCHPKIDNNELRQIWSEFNGNSYHVIGNHDHELTGITREDVVKFWDMPGKFYSSDIKGYHLVVLDGNDSNPAHDTPWRYERYISVRQLEWLSDDLANTNLPCIVCCHQGLDRDSGLENGGTVRAILDRANKAAGFQKVQLVLTGHHHQDYYNQINGIHYIQINSMSYYWQGEKFAESPFDDALNRRYKYLKYMNHYKDPLWAYIKISRNGILSVTGQKSTFIGKSPTEMGMPAYFKTYPVVPHISCRKIKLN